MAKPEQTIWLTQYLLSTYSVPKSGLGIGDTQIKDLGEAGVEERSIGKEGKLCMRSYCEPGSLLSSRSPGVQIKNMPAVQENL